MLITIYLFQELWRGSLKWSGIKIMILFFAFIVCPPVWMVFSLPLGHKFNKIPIIKFMSYLTAHIYLMILLSLVAITPIYNSIFRESLVPRWYEWMLLISLSGLLLFELTNPSDKSGLGWIKIAVLLFGMVGVATHVIGWMTVQTKYWPTLMYCRNQCFALSFLLACVQILDFLSFHHLFGPWAIIIGDLMKDLGRFLAVLAIFVFGFSMHIVALNQPFRNILKVEDNKYARQMRKKIFSDGEDFSFTSYSHNSHFYHCVLTFMSNPLYKVHTEKHFIISYHLTVYCCIRKPTNETPNVRPPMD